jgi:hypothetical protein
MSKIFRTFIRNLFFEPVQDRPRLDPFPGLNPPTAAPKIPRRNEADVKHESDIDRIYKRFKTSRVEQGPISKRKEWKLND